MVVVAQKIGTLCIEYRPRETIAYLVDDEGIFDDKICSQFIVETKFYAGYVPFLPIYALDARYYSWLKIRCYSIFDALDFIAHLSLQEFEFKFVPPLLGAPEDGNEFDINSVESEGSRASYWTFRIHIAQKADALILSNRENQTENLSGLKFIYLKNK